MKLSTVALLAGAVALAQAGTTFDKFNAMLTKLTKRGSMDACAGYPSECTFANFQTWRDEFATALALVEDPDFDLLKAGASMVNFSCAFENMATCANDYAAQLVNLTTATRVSYNDQCPEDYRKGPDGDDDPCCTYRAVNGQCCAPRTYYTEIPAFDGVNEAHVEALCGAGESEFITTLLTLNSASLANAEASVATCFDIDAVMGVIQESQTATFKCFNLYSVPGKQCNSDTDCNGIGSCTNEICTATFDEVNDYIPVCVSDAIVSLKPQLLAILKEKLGLDQSISIEDFRAALIEKLAGDGECYARGSYYQSLSGLTSKSACENQNSCLGYPDLNEGQCDLLAGSQVCNYCSGNALGSSDPYCYVKTGGPCYTEGTRCLDGSEVNDPSDCATVGYCQYFGGALPCNEDGNNLPCTEQECESLASTYGACDDQWAWQGTTACIGPVDENYQCSGSFTGAQSNFGVCLFDDANPIPGAQSCAQIGGTTVTKATDAESCKHPEIGGYCSYGEATPRSIFRYNRPTWRAGDYYSAQTSNVTWTNGGFQWYQRLNYEVMNDLQFLVMSKQIAPFYGRAFRCMMNTIFLYGPQIACACPLLSNLTTPVDGCPVYTLPDSDKVFDKPVYEDTQDGVELSGNAANPPFSVDNSNETVKPGENDLNVEVTTERPDLNARRRSVESDNYVLLDGDVIGQRTSYPMRFNFDEAKVTSAGFEFCVGEQDALAVDLDAHPTWTKQVLVHACVNKPENYVIVSDDLSPDDFSCIITDRAGYYATARVETSAVVKSIDCNTPSESDEDSDGNDDSSSASAVFATVAMIAAAIAIAL